MEWSRRWTRPPPRSSSTRSTEPCHTASSARRRLEGVVAIGSHQVFERADLLRDLRPPSGVADPERTGVNAKVLDLRNDVGASLDGRLDGLEVVVLRQVRALGADDEGKPVVAVGLGEG